MLHTYIAQVDSGNEVPGVYDELKGHETISREEVEEIDLCGYISWGGGGMRFAVYQVLNDNLLSVYIC